jgi:hypothetical protein
MLQTRLVVVIYIDAVSGEPLFYNNTIKNLENTIHKKMGLKPQSDQ